MPDPLTILAAGALAVIAMTVLLARLIPDDYDRYKPEALTRGVERS
jgi:hypothetical protein